MVSEELAFHRGSWITHCGEVNVDGWAWMGQPGHMGVARSARMAGCGWVSALGRRDQVSMEQVSLANWT